MQINKYIYIIYTYVIILIYVFHLHCTCIVIHVFDNTRDIVSENIMNLKVIIFHSNRIYRLYRKFNTDYIRFRKYLIKHVKYMIPSIRD